MTKANSPLSPLAVGSHDIFGYKCDRSGLTDQFVLIRVGFRRDQGEHGAAVRRRNSYPALSGLKAHIKGKVESELIHVEPRASVLIADENVDRVNAEVGVVAIKRELGHGPLLYLSDRSQGVIEIVHDVFRVLNSHGDTDQSIRNSDFSPSLFAQRCVGHSRRMRNQGLNSTQGFRQRAHAYFPQHFLGIGERSGFERDHRTKAGHLLLRQVVLWMFGKSGIEDFLHFLMASQKFGNNSATTIVLLLAHGQSLYSPQDEPALERRENRSRSFLHEGQLVSLFFLSADYNAAQAVAVSIQKFCGRVDNHVRSQSNRLLEVWRHESVVHHQFRFIAPAYLAAGRNVA